MNKIFQLIGALAKFLYGLLDKYIITPISKIIYNINKKINKNNFKIEKILNENFIKCSRSYIININKMREYNTKDNIITLNGNLKIYEISRQKKKEIINIMRKAKLLNLSNFVVKEQK